MIKKLLKFALPLLVFSYVGAYYYVNFTADQDLHEVSALEIAGNECDAIAEKAAMVLPEFLPFQKLEKAARKARVLENCMHDRAYIENPAWVKLAESIAQKNAQVQKVSFDEAYEATRRNAMYIFKTSHDEPLYWTKTLGQ